MMEERKTIENYEGLYEVSNLGRVKSVGRIGKRINKKEKMLGLRRKPYKIVGLCKNNIRKCFKVHRLVAGAFIPNPKLKSEVNHKNGIKDDNRVENLERTTHQENCKYTYAVLGVKGSKALLGKFGILHHCSKPIVQYTKQLELIKKWNCGADTQRELGYRQTNITRCCKGKLKQAYGFIRKYAE